jgi:O-antigen ligase
VLAFLLAWLTFAAGGVYFWVWIPWAAALLVMMLATRPSLGSNVRTRPLDAALGVSMLIPALQLVPLPVSVLLNVDPGALVLRARLRLIPMASHETLYLPVSIVPTYTAEALVIFAGAVATYWIARDICERGGAGLLVRSIAFIGLGASLAAVVQQAESPALLYGIWKPEDAGARPYGPFVNRNHFATWMIMATPLVFGYLLARAPTRPAGGYSRRLAGALKQLGTVRIWLVTAVCVMALAVLISASRSGLIALTAALAATGAVGMLRRPAGPGGGSGNVVRWTVFQAGMLAAVVLSFGNAGTVLARIDETLAAAGAGRGRVAVWRDTLRLIHDFSVTGTGAGTFGAAVPAYQTAAPGYSIGHAHNHYLHLAAEGGIVLIVVFALVAGAFVYAVAGRSNEDRGQGLLIRAGATAGIGAVMLQSVWETGLRMPANAMLCGILAAIATYGVRSSHHATD